MLKRATYTGADAIMSFYDAINGDNGYLYSVWHNDKDIAFQYFGEDSAKARALLEDNLRALEEAENCDLLYIKFHPPVTGKARYIDRKTPVVSTTPVRVHALEDVEISGVSLPGEQPRGMPYQMYQAIEGVKTLPGIITGKLTEFDERLRAMEVLPEEQEPEADPFDKWAARIGGLMQNPAVMEGLGQILNFLKPAPAPLPWPHVINGAMAEDEQTQTVQANEPDVNEDLLNDALNRLHPHCVLDQDFQLLAKMAEENPALFKTMLSMLRAQK